MEQLKVKNKKSPSANLKRRRILAGLASVSVLSPLFALNSKAVNSDFSVFSKPTSSSKGLSFSEEIFVSASGAKQETFGLSWTGLSNKIVWQLESGFRGHSVCINPVNKNQVVFFGRRPSRKMLLVDVPSGKINQQINCSNDRHLFGHGIYSNDGQYLFSCEGNISSGLGVVVVRETTNYQIVEELQSYGTGPHEIKMLSDNKTLVIANGGILTRPDSGRKKLNLETMQSSLTYINVENGDLIEQAKVAEPKASIRHLDVAQDGTVAFAIQMQRQAASHQKLVALAGQHKLGKPIQLFDEPAMLIHQMNDYMGSVSINSATRTAGFTSPRGNIAAFWKLDSGEYLGHHALTDVCGICITHDQSKFVISSSGGQIRFLDAVTLKEHRDLRITSEITQWDNHLTRLAH